ncbi:hypothetical protein CRG98_030030 [Punica granatum]|uniref:Uncharacterized protein n=1 Tax=Punica granatum TaxID=22663 RepID=A0A2I0J033_PUNGR|nr:hypothetical protein CRG98_030030 [Punica granatum]
MAIQAELTHIRAERDHLRREVVENDEQLVDQRQLQRELTQTRAELQRCDQELTRVNAALERSRKRARGGVSPAHRGASPTHLPPPASSGLHPAYSGGQPSSTADNRARIAVLESTVNQLAATMATNMAELMALLKGPNRASSSFTPPLGYGPTVDPSPWAQPTLIPDNGDTSAPTIVNAPAAHPVNNLPASPSFSHPANLPTVTPIPSATMLEPPKLVPPPISTPVPVSVSASIPAPTSAIPPPIIFLPTIAQALAYTVEPPPYQAPQPHIGFSYQAPPPINIAYSEPGTPSHAAPRAPPTNFLPETGTEQEQRLKKYCAETPSTLLELSTMEMTEDQGFEAYAVKWRARAAKHVPPITQQVYYSAPPASFPSPVPQQYAHNYAPAPPPIQQSRPPVSRTPQPGAPGHTTDNCWKLRERIQQMIEDKQLTFNAVKPPNVQSNLLLDHGSSSGPSINMIGVCAIGEVRYHARPIRDRSPRQEPYQDSQVPWTYEGSVGNLERQFSVIDVTRSGRVYENPKAANKGKAPAVPGVAPEGSSIPQKKVTEEEAEAFMKIIKASEYKVVEQMGKSPAHISLLALLLGLEPRREALLKVLTAAQVLKETAPDLIAETVASIFSNNISFSDDELPSKGWAHSRALHIVCKCNNFIIGRVMIDNGSALNVCPVSTLKQMNVDFNRIRPSKTAVRAFDGSRKEVNGEINLVIEVGPCSFAVTIQVLDISNAFSLLLGRPWIHAAGAVPSSLH